MGVVVFTKVRGLAKSVKSVDPWGPWTFKLSLAFAETNTSIGINFSQ
jgi:hypothetical protein